MESLESFLFLSFLSFLPLGSGWGAGWVSPATGVEPGAGCAEVVSPGAVLWVAEGGLDEGAGSDGGVDCAQPAEATARANTVAVAVVRVFLPVKLLVIATPPGKPHLYPASLDLLDASIRLLATERKNISRFATNVRCGGHLII